MENKLQTLKELQENATKKLTGYSKSKFFVEEENLLKEVTGLPAELLTESIEQIDSGIVSELVPEYEKTVFRIMSYTEKRRKN